MRGEFPTGPRGAQRLDDAVLSGRRIGVDGQPAPVVGNTDRSVGVQRDGDLGPTVAGISHLFHRVVDQLPQGGVENVQTEVDRRPKACVLDIVELGDVSGGVAHVGPFPLNASPVES